jgi:hypothetical protein
MHSLSRYEGLETRKTLCTNPLSQLHEILSIVVARFISAIPVGRLLHYKYENTMSQITMTVHKLKST